MSILESIQGIIAVVVVIILNLAVVAKGVAAIVKNVKSIQQTTREERELAKASVIQNLQQIIFGLVTEAEKELGGGTGKLKSAKVAGWIYDKIPDELKALFTPAEIQDMIDDGLRAAQKYWETNSKARQYIDSGATALLTAEAETVAPAVGVDEIVKAVGDRIGEAIVKATETPTDGGEQAGDSLPADGQPDATGATEAATEAENEAPEKGA